MPGNVTQGSWKVQLQKAYYLVSVHHYSGNAACITASPPHPQPYNYSKSSCATVHRLHTTFHQRPPARPAATHISFHASVHPTLPADDHSSPVTLQLPESFRRNRWSHSAARLHIRFGPLSPRREVAHMTPTRSPAVTAGH